MDFLDPKKKRDRQISLHIRHFLMVFFVAAATYLLVSYAYGFKIDEKTGEIIQDGLLYIDSAPDGAQLAINGKYYDDTNTRVSLPEGDYELEITKEGYRPWHHTLHLDGGEVERLTYPVLFPNTLNAASINTFDAKIIFGTQSPDKRWVILAKKNNLSSFIQYDLNEGRVNDLPQSKDLQLDSNLLTNASGSHSFKLIEWSTDNKHFLVRHNWNGGFEYVMINRDKPAESFNLSGLLSKQPDKVAMVDKKFDRLFVYDAQTKTLDKFNVSDRQSTNFASNILSFKPHGSDKVLLSRIVPGKKMAEVALLEDDNEYIIRDVPVSKNIPLDIAQSDGDWYAAISDVKDKRTYIYKNPQQLFVEHPNMKNVLTVILTNDKKIDDLSFSNNARFILSRSGQQFSVYDTEKDERFQYTIKDKLSEATPPAWMDGHRILGYSDGKILVFQFDGSNKQTLVEADSSLPTFFDRDYTELYSFGTPKGKSSSSLFLTQLRLDGDK